MWKGTVFESLKLKPEKILTLAKLWLLCLPTRHICLLLDINRKTFARILKKISTHIVPKYYSTSLILGSENVIVEIDESKFGKRKYNRGHRVEGVWVLGICERTAERKVFYQAVPNRKEVTLLPILKERIHPKSTVYSDCWRAYSNLAVHFAQHGTVNHSVGFKDIITGVHTNVVEGNWSAVKAQTPVRCRTVNLINIYLIRYMINRNEKENAFVAFIKLLF
ncbi:MAG: IS1595 family transposase [Aeromonas sp.]